MILSCYFESWDEYLTPLSSIEAEYTHVNIAFANPNGTFDGASFRNTGKFFYLLVVLPSRSLIILMVDIW